MGILTATYPPSANLNRYMLPESALNEMDEVISRHISSKITSGDTQPNWEPVNKMAATVFHTPYSMKR